MSYPDPLAGIPASVFARRRADVFDALGGDVMVVPSAPVLIRSRDTEAPYRPDSELYYLTGATEPGAVAVLIGGDEPRWVLFVPDRDPSVELWAGPRPGPEDASVRYGADETWPASEIDERLPRLLQRGGRTHFRPGRADALERMVMDALAEARRRGPRHGTGPRAIVDPGGILDELRLRKDAHEIARLRAAAALSVEGHRAGAAAMGPGVGEWVVEAAVDACFRRAGAAGPSYETIVGSGANACILHYVANRRTMEAGDLVLVDAGAELALYAGDITRTYPAGGRFSAAQRAIYQVVEAARAAGVAAVRPGESIGAVHRAAVHTLVEGLVALGVLKGSADDLIAEDAHKAYYPHQTSHWLGLDVHDPGDYERQGASRVLEPGMAFTVEPGLYFRDPEGAAAPYAGIGIRIEDDVLVTPDGCENLTGALPSDLEGVEELVREAR